MTSPRPEPRTGAGRILLREHSSGTPHMAKHILAIEAQAVELWLASPEAWERMTEALHHLHSLEMWRWWEPQSDGSAIVRRGTSPDFAAVILQALRAANPSDAPLQGGDE